MAGLIEKKRACNLLQKLFQHRKFIFDRKTKKFQITDMWVSAREYKTGCIFFTAVKPEKITDNKIKLGKLFFTTDNGKLSCKEVDISDEKVKKRWGKLWKIILRHPEPQKSGNHTITISP